jgi:hypothetical protein
VFLLCESRDIGLCFLRGKVKWFLACVSSDEISFHSRPVFPVCESKVPCLRFLMIYRFSPTFPLIESTYSGRFFLVCDRIMACVSFV